MINFYIPDFWGYKDLNNVLHLFMVQHSECFYDDIQIGAIYGTFPGAIWNGGRFSAGIANLDEIKKTIDLFNAQGIPLRFTFTNSLLEEKHIYDTYCNLIMNAAHNGCNEVLINSPILEEYLRAEYPNYKYILSTTAGVRGLDNINQACDKYDMVVLNYNDNKNQEILNGLKDKNKIEILLNETCNPNCPKRKEHYDFISSKQLQFLPWGKKEDFQCFSDGEVNAHLMESRESLTFINDKELWNKYIPNGFSNFKIQGRGLPFIFAVDSYMMYMVKPEYRDIVRYELFKVLEANQMNQVIHMN